jgi:hypothetical protein
VQEVLLSKDVWVLMGDRLATFNFFQCAGTLAQLAGFVLSGHVGRMDDEIPLDLHAKARENIITLSHLKTNREAISEGQLPGFMSVMDMSRTQKCSDLRDTLYSILGICSDFCKDGKILLEPDYTNPVSEIYLQATSFIIRARNDLAVLNLVSNRRSTPDLPSWCPDFVHLHATINGFAKQSRPWRLSDSPEQSVQISDHSLGVYGQRIGTVNEVVFLFRRADRHPDLLQEWLSTGLPPICSLLTRLETGGSAEALYMCVISTLHVLRNLANIKAGKSSLVSSFCGAQSCSI